MAATPNRRARPDEANPREASVNKASTHSDDPIVFFDHKPAVRLYRRGQLEFCST
jgi:hypothetical protein